MTSTILFAASGLRDDLASSRPTDWWTFGVIAVPLALALLVLLIKRTEKSSLREWIGMILLTILGINIGGQWPGGSPIRWLQPMLSGALQAVMAEKPEAEAPKSDKLEAEKPKAEQSSEAAPAAETPTIAEAEKPKAKEKTTTVTPLVSLNATWEDVEPIGSNEFKIKKTPPDGVSWYYSVSTDPETGGKAVKASPESTVKVPPLPGKEQWVRFFMAKGAKGGKFVDFKVDATPSEK